MTLPGLRSYTLLAGRALAGAQEVDVELLHTLEYRFVGASVGHNVSVLGFDTDGELLGVGFEGRRRRLEFIGDSITAGAGNVLLDPCIQSAFTNDFSRCGLAPVWGEEEGSRGLCRCTSSARPAHSLIADRALATCQVVRTLALQRP
jgi:hypothetical protein